MVNTVREANQDDRERWNTFVSTMPDSNLAHSYEWHDILQRIFGHQPRYLIAESQGEIDGVLPLFLVRGALFGKALISMPYLNGGGALASNDTAYRSLINHVLELRKSLGARYLELRERRELPELAGGFSVRSHKVAMQLPLKESPEAMLESFKSKLRSQIQRPKKEGAIVEVIGGNKLSESVLQEFYQVFTINMRDLGTPTYPIELFRESLRQFGERARLILVKVHGVPAAGAITLRHQQIVEIPWASSIRKFNPISPNMLLYWSAIERSIADGAKLFDFGRSSRDSSTLKFKEQWGATPLDLHWYYDNSSSVPDVNPRSAKFSILVKLWRHLPLPIANTIGPQITKHLP